MLAESTIEPIPLRTDANGVIRIEGTRVPLDTVVHAYLDGSTPEEIVQDFSVLRLDDVYAVLTYYLRHRDAVDEYLREREREADALRREIESQHPQALLRQRLLARQAR